jgi:hypothetical protein
VAYDKTRLIHSTDKTESETFIVSVGNYGPECFVDGRTCVIATIVMKVSISVQICMKKVEQRLERGLGMRWDNEIKSP